MLPKTTVNMKNTPDPEYDEDAGYACETGQVKLFNQHQNSHMGLCTDDFEHLSKMHRISASSLIQTKRTAKASKINETKMADF